MTTAPRKDLLLAATVVSAALRFYCASAVIIIRLQMD